MRLLTTLFLIFALSGCQSAYYATMEKVGVHKRDIMADRVEAASEAQQEASEQFTSALEALTALTNFDGGELEAMYNTINDQYEESEATVENVKERIEAVEDVSDALFDEWQEELSLYSSAKLRRESERKLKNTERSYTQMLAAMRKAESKMEPVLDTLRDNSLYLKHNLNAAAIGALKGEFAGLEDDINLAIKDMQAAINESERFLATLKN
ncbi:DUF2959 domain-containing protein [Enterovibrio norvegicus]|uniref:DNA repair protein n=2 Tax=Enterovibrio norvegicus TaxID=188144 RepID=A0A2N7L7K0_9GAMM|nr:DUF2959 domain-containing protein [Enterovibrio norvegicus]MCC4797455.1 DUF2959 domain-containing protein [Enterovibrio norvegicus]OEE52901.1 DNA repair protein [Enterovibrio norvegicus]OEF49109.1 DNA repair protein [Enterovibrio norvegicus]OEF59954.1 DNA repair protein [Enterovibrio norvegicus]PMH64652.1 DNA repair protein [Enterovibrio norvegicus]